MLGRTPSLLAGSRAASGLPVAWMRMSTLAPQITKQRCNVSTGARADGGAAAGLAGQQTAAPPAHHPPAGSAGGGSPKKVKQLVMPTPVPPPAVPDDLSAWDNAVLLVDKPPGWTSFDVCGKLRGALAALLRKKNREVKVGHAGTLDPMATGLLIVCVGRGTKAVDAFMAMTKRYSGSLRLGEGTPSYDAASPVEERLPWEHVTDEDLLRARDGLLGDIQQLPPMYSAIKVAGQRLYQAARKGQEVERQPRAVTVHSFRLWRDAAQPQQVHFDVVCSKGTYIRSLAHDLGRACGTAAHLTALRREAIGEHEVGAAWDVQQLAQQLTEQRRQRRAAEEGGQRRGEPALAAGQQAAAGAEAG